MTLPDKDSIDTYGGTKTDYQPVEDASTDRSADEINGALASVAMMTRTCLRAYAMFTTHGSAPTVDEHEALWGNANAVKPAVTVSGTGIYLINWPETVDDELGTEHSVNLLTGWAQIDAQSAFKHVTITKVNAFTFQVRVYDSSHALDGTTGLKVKVWVL